MHNDSHVSADTTAKKVTGLNLYTCSKITFHLYLRRLVWTLLAISKVTLKNLSANTIEKVTTFHL